MRILYLTNGFPYPLTSGYLRHYFFIRELAKRHEITLLSIVAPNFEPQNIQALVPFTKRILTFSSTNKGVSLRKKAGNRLKALTGISSLDEAVQNMRAEGLRLTRDQSFDVIFFSGKRTFPTIENINPVPLVVDMCDSASLHVRGKMYYAPLYMRPLLLLDYVQLRRIEQDLIKAAAHVLFATCRDREAMLAQGSSHTSVVPNGVNLDYWKRTSAVRGRNTIIFTGGMNYPPNTDAALYLIQEIFPRVQQSVPEARLLIVGRDPAPALVKAGRRPNVTVTGFVEDVRPYLEQSTVFAAPLRFGAGIQNKVLEAMAMELPVVASPLAADGLRTEKGDIPPIQVAQTTKEFVEQISLELLSWENSPAADANSRQYIAQNFNWEHSGLLVEKVIRDVAVGPSEDEIERKTCLA